MSEEAETERGGRGRGGRGRGRGGRWEESRRQEYTVTSDESSTDYEAGSSAAETSDDDYDNNDPGSPPTQSVFVQIVNVGSVNNLSNLSSLRGSPPHQPSKKSAPGNMGARPKTSKPTSPRKVPCECCQSQDLKKNPAEEKKVKASPKQQTTSDDSLFNVYPDSTTGPEGFQQPLKSTSVPFGMNNLIQHKQGSNPDSKPVAFVNRSHIEHIRSDVQNLLLARKIKELELELNKQRSIGRKTQNQLQERDTEVMTLRGHLEKRENEVNDYKDTFGDCLEKKRKKPAAKRNISQLSAATPDEGLSETVPMPLDQTYYTAVSALKDSADINAVDEVAKQVSQGRYGTVAELFKALIDAPGYSLDLQKARAIFVWLLTTEKSGEECVPEEIASIVIDDINSLLYSKALHLLYTRAGLRCEMVSGQRAAHISGGCTEETHWWNVVLLGDSNWYLVDSYCAATTIKDVSSLDESVIEQFFLPEPKEFINTHYPKECRWQLLPQIWSQQQFQTQIPVKAIFKNGLRIVTHGQEIKHAFDGTVTIRVECQDKNVGSMEFDFSLTYTDGRSRYNGWELSLFGMHHMEGNMAVFTIRPPEKGTYRLILASSDRKTFPERAEGHLGVICEYEVICESSPQDPLPYPHRGATSKSWGPQSKAADFDLIPQQHGVTFTTNTGTVELSFLMQRPVRFWVKLEGAHGKGQQETHVLHRIVANASIFKIVPPTVGEYGLAIYANDPDRDNDDFCLVYQYLIICIKQLEVPLPYPKLPVNYLGVQPASKHCNLSPLSHVDPYIELHTNDLQLSFHTNFKVKITTIMALCEGQGFKTLRGHVLQQRRNHILTFCLRFPQPGFYRFEIYALPSDDTGEQLPNVFNYFINYRGSSTGQVFPTQLPKSNCLYYLYEPMNGLLKPSLENMTDNGRYIEYKQHFKLEMPGIEEAVVACGGNLTQLEQLQPGLWEGDVTLKMYTTLQSKVVLCSRSHGNNNMEALLHYTQCKPPLETAM